MGYPDINAVFGLLGSTCAVCVIFVLPTMLWVKFSPLPFDPMMSPRSSPYKQLMRGARRAARERERAALHVVTSGATGGVNAAGELVAYDELGGGAGANGGGVRARARAPSVREMRLQKTLASRDFGWSKAWRRYRWRFWTAAALMTFGTLTGVIGTLFEIFKIANAKFLYK